MNHSNKFLFCPDITINTECASRSPLSVVSKKENSSDFDTESETHTENALFNTAIPEKHYKKQAQLSLIPLSYTDIMVKMLGDYKLKSENCMENGSYNKCISYCNKYIWVNPYQSKIYILKAEAYIKLMDYKSAINNYKQALVFLKIENVNRVKEISEKLSVVYFFYSIFLNNTHQFDKALENINFSIKIDPNNETFVFQCILYLINSKQYDKCIKLISLKIKEHPNNDKYHLMRASLHLKKNEHTLAYYNLKECLKIKNNQAAVNLLLQIINFSKKFYKSARDFYIEMKFKKSLVNIKLAISLNPECIKYYLLNAILLYKCGNYKESIHEFDNIIKNYDPDDPKYNLTILKSAHTMINVAMNAYSTKLIHFNQIETALVLLKIVKQSNPTIYQIYVNLGDCYLYLKKIKPALKYYTLAETLNKEIQMEYHIKSRIAMIHVYQSYNLFEKYEYKRCIWNLNKAIQIDNFKGEYYLLRSKCHENLKVFYI
ncbi:hypothetical protein A3Q56_00052 [Intoshia linei]|uniref:Uncharacterized protein n=1 Tax=Intoshia linei TaxID=1819745 RepID=A0A177BF23_9BILA|nr:hypothetical protein A3Q56_00052 [Intoshia linei]